MKTKFYVALGTLAVFVALGTVATPRAFAQAVYGSIFGTITDPSGAAVAGAKVVVTSATKGTTVEATTNTDGNYSVTHLIPDVYNIRAEGAGFKAFEQKNIQVSADAGARVDGQFQVGGSTETVEVTGEAPQLKTDRADVATTFNDKYVQDVPILNRNFTNLQLMAPGSQKMVGWSHAATENPQGSLQIFTQGQHFSGTAFELDGTDNQDPILGIIVVNPNLDAVTEAKVALAELRRRVRQSSRQRRNCADQVGHQRVSRQRILVPPLGCPAGARSLYAIANRIRSPAASFRRPAGSSSAAQSVARSSKTSCSFSAIIRAHVRPTA